MKKEHVQRGGVYAARVSGRLVPVLVEGMVEPQGYWVRNLATRRLVKFRTAGRLRYRVCDACTKTISLSVRPARFRRKSTGECLCREHASTAPTPVESMTIEPQVEREDLCEKEEP